MAHNEVNRPSNPARKDAQGRNTVLSLQYFRDFFRLQMKKRYEQMNIHERITIRASYCGVVYPSICVMEDIRDN